MTRKPVQKDLLDNLLKEVETAVIAGETLVVFDLDDTLFLTTNRHLRILREYAQRLESRDPASAGIVRAIARESLRYAITDTVKDAGLQEELVQDLKDFWFARFFKNPYLLEDDAIAGGAQYCREIVRRGARAIYMTGRDEGMREGTEAALARHGFPAADGKSASLILKPRFDAPDLAFKTEALAKLKELGRVAGSFENEPAHINLFRDTFPQARHFLLETKHSGKPILPHPDVHRIKDFRR